MDKRARQQTHSDVLVVGGGAAGVAAAVTAARQGLSVTLVERYGFCGGGAVAGLSGTICGLYEATDDALRPPQQLVFGFADEFCRVLKGRGGLTEALRYGKTWTHVHDPLIWREAADFLLGEAGVRVIFHAIATGVHVEGGEGVKGIEIFTKQGVVDARASIVIDASGDADLVAMAGLPYIVGHNGHVQNPTMIFRMLDVDVGRFIAAYGNDTIMPIEVSKLIESISSSKSYNLPRTKIWLFTTTRPNEIMCNCTRIIGRDGRELNTLIYEDFTEAETEGRLQVREYARFLQNYLTGFERAFVNDTGVQVGVRQTRQVTGMEQLKKQDVISGKKMPTGIARSPWPIELHSGKKPEVKWLLNDYYEVPFGSLIPERGEGLIVAGRCLSAEHEAVASARVTAQCFAYGHAAGHAAALAIHEGMAIRTIAGEEIRLAVNRDGGRLE